MPVDASIALGVRPPQIEPTENALLRVLQMKGLQQQQESGALDLGMKRSAIERQNKLDQVLRGFTPGMKTEDQVGALTREGHLDAARKLAESASKVSKEQREAEKFQLENGMKKVGFVAQLLSTARDQPSYDQARAEATAQGLDVSTMPPQFDPQLIATKLQQAQTIEQQLAQVWKQKGFDLEVRKADETGRHNQATEKNAAGQLAVSQGNLNVNREQLGLSRQRLENEKNAPRGQFLETPNGYVLADPRGGTTAPVLGPDGKQLKGKTADRSLNETQAKANLFGTRMREADRILGGLAQAGVNTPGLIKQGAEAVPLVGGALAAGINTLPGALGGPSGPQQQVEQAQRDFINAVLRRESGAAIAESEFSNARKQYFPQPGDDAGVIAQKANNRRLAIQGLEVEVPGGFRSPGAQIPPPVQPSTGGATGGWGGDGKVVDFGSLQ